MVTQRAKSAGRIRAAFLLGACGLLGAVSAPGMVRHVSIFQPPVSFEQFDPWYFSVHSQECISYYGPWLKRYVTYKSVPVPDVGDPTIYRGRYTELWYDSVDAWREADPYRRSYSAAPWPGGGLSSPDRPSASMLVGANPTEDFLHRQPVPSAGPFVRVLTAIRYPAGVSIADGERWYLDVYAKETSKLPGLLRYVSSHAVPNSPLPSTWVRMDELWFRDFQSWRQAMAQSELRNLRAPWAGAGKPSLETITTFVNIDPDKNFLQ